MSRSQNTFLVKQTLTSICFNAVFSALAVWLVFRHMALVPLSGSPSLIADSILQTFIATLMSTLPPSLLTARWMLTTPDPTTPDPTTPWTPTVRIWIRALLTAFAGSLASSVVLPFAMPRLLAASLPFGKMLVLKCLYGMAIGLVATPFAVTSVLRGPHRGEGTEESIGRMRWRKTRQANPAEPPSC